MDNSLYCCERLWIQFDADKNGALDSNELGNLFLQCLADSVSHQADQSPDSLLIDFVARKSIAWTEFINFRITLNTEFYQAYKDFASKNQQTVPICMLSVFC